MRHPALPRGVVVAGFVLLSIIAAGLVGRPAPNEHRPARDADRAEEGGGQTPAPDAWWSWRLTYPTGRFDPAWITAAAKQDALLPSGLPRGTQEKSAGVLDPLRVTALGPSPLDWSDGYGLVGGRVNAIVSHPRNSNVSWFASDGGGVWKTDNCCGTDTRWRPTTDGAGIRNPAISTLVLDPADPDVLYAGTGDPLRNRPFAFGASGLLKSSDGGESWKVLATDLFNPVYAEPAGLYPQRRSISAIAVDPRDGRRLAVGTSQGFYVSADAGEHWAGPCFSNAFSSQRQDVSALLAIDDGSATRLVVAVGSLRSGSSLRFDLGQNGANGVYAAAMPDGSCPTAWTVLSRPDNGWPARSANGVPASASGNPLGRIDLAVAPSDHRVLYAQVMALGVWRSADGGATWAQVASQPGSFATGCRSASFDNGIGFQDYNNGLSVSASDPNTLFLSSIDLWRSTDGGSHFTDLTCAYDRLPDGRNGYVHPDQHARAVVVGNPQRLLIGNDGGVFVSDDVLAAAPRFRAINGGTNTIEFYSGDLTAGFNDPTVARRGIAAGAQDNGTDAQEFGPGVAPGVASWHVAFGGDGTYAKIEPVRGERWYYASQGGFIKATSGGPDGQPYRLVTPEDALTGDNWAGDRTGFLTSFDLYKHGDETTCPAASGCQRMIAGTYRVWESLTAGLPNSSWFPNSPDLTKALSADSNLSIINKVAFSYSDPSVALVGTNDGNVWLGFGLGVGPGTPATWVRASGDNTVLPNRPVMDVVSDPRTPTVVYAALAGFAANTPATPGHLFRLDCTARCGTATWSDKSGNLPDIPVNALAVNPNAPRQVYAGTDWGLYYTDDIEAASPRWIRFDGGLPVAMVFGLAIDRGATTLAIFTRSRGAYVWPLPKSVAAVELDQRGLTGPWYEPSTAGQGFELEVYPDNLGPGRGILFAGWFTYDATVAGGRRWYALSGEVRRGESTATLDIYSLGGGNFDAPPTRAAGTPVGSATLSFASCEQGELRYRFDDGSKRQGVIALTRLTPNVSCTPTGDSGVAPASVTFSGSWYQPTTSGQGLLFDFSPSIHYLFAAWYTYAANGSATGGPASQRWFTLQTSAFVDGRTTISDIPIYETGGGAFDQPIPTTTTAVGSAEVVLLSCQTMTLRYRFDSGEFAGRSGAIPLERVGPTPANCRMP